jgi:monoamine oxidase
VARTPLAQRVEDAFSTVVEARRRGVPTQEVLEERRVTRRELLKRAGVAGVAVAGASTAGRFAKAAYGAGGPRIVVVGAGLAGLTAAYRLKQAGFSADVYEASDRIGGRCWSYRASSGTWAEGQVAEHGGELIDQGHTAMRQLAQELGFKLDNLLAGEQNGTEDFFFLDGAYYTNAELTNDLNGIYQKLHKDTVAASYPTHWDSYTQRGLELDRMSIIKWLDETCPNGGSKSRLGRILDIAYNIEYGAECSQQSSLNLIYLLGYIGQGQFRVFGKSNEKYHVSGGNDQVPQALADALAAAGKPVQRNSELVAIASNASRTAWTLTFNAGGTTKTVTADHVVLALPFSMLRGIDFSKAHFDPLKVTAINELGMGTNSKLHVQFTKRYWNQLGNNGNTYADTGYQNTWEVSRSQAGTSGLLVDYTGGKTGASFGTGTPASRASQFLKQIEPVLPGISKYWNGRATVDFWTTYPWTKGSYSYWKVGQYTKFSGMEPEAQGTCHFAGEHTSQDSQGYLNGGVESGERAAAEIVAAYK